MRGRGVTEDRAKTLVEAAHNSVGLDGGIGTKSELYMLLEEHCLWTSQLEAINKVLEETILKVPYAEKLLAIKGVGSITIAGFIAEVGDIRRFDSPKQIQKYAGMELDAYIESSGLTQEEYQSNMEEYGKNVAAQALVCQAICDKEGFAIGDDDYQKALQDMLTEYGCTEDELIQTYGQDNVEQSIMLNRVSNLILENANVTEVQADSSADSSSDDSGN